MVTRKTVEFGVVILCTFAHVIFYVSRVLSMCTNTDVRGVVYRA